MGLFFQAPVINTINEALCYHEVYLRAWTYKYEQLQDEIICNIESGSMLQHDTYQA
jgi:hypothetical protein